ncbi:MAG: hypothetical protein WC423_01365 [Vulcanimicrobiota bacterium]
MFDQERARLLLAAHGALLGEVFPSLSVVNVSWGERWIKFWFFLSNAPSEDDLESMSIVEAEMLAQYPDREVMSEFYVDAPRGRGAVCIFARKNR